MSLIHSYWLKKVLILVATSCVRWLLTSRPGRCLIAIPFTLLTCVKSPFVTFLSHCLVLSYYLALFLPSSVASPFFFRAWYKQPPPHPPNHSHPKPHESPFTYTVTCLYTPFPTRIMRNTLVVALSVFGGLVYAPPPRPDTHSRKPLIMFARG